jgi:hypothetical protein
MRPIVAERRDRWRLVADLFIGCIQRTEMVGDGFRTWGVQCFSNEFLVEVARPSQQLLQRSLDALFVPRTESMATGLGLHELRNRYHRGEGRNSRPFRFRVPKHSTLQPMGRAIVRHSADAEFTRDDVADHCRAQGSSVVSIHAFLGQATRYLHQ